MDRRSARRRRDRAPVVQAARRHPRADLRHGARARHPGRDVLRRPRQRRALRRRAEAPHLQGGLVGEAPRGRHRARRHTRRRHPRGRRDRRGDVVAVRRAGRAGRDRPAVLRAHPRARAAGGAARPVPRVGQHRPEGRPRAAAAGPGPRRAAPRRARDRQRDRRARGEVRDGGRLREPGVRQADDRRLGPAGALGLRRRVHRAHGRSGDQARLPLRLRRHEADRGLPADEPLRRGRHADRVRRRRDPVGGRAVLPAHPGGGLHPPDAAPLQPVRVRPAASCAMPTCSSARRTRA